MAQGDFTFFNQFLDTLGKGGKNLDTATIRWGLITSTVTPVATTADPRWGAGGSTNLSTNEVTAGGNYTAGGPDVSATYSVSTNVGTLDSANVTIAQNASNPTNARWAILYIDDTDDYCIGFADLGSVFDMTTGDLVINTPSGIGTITRT